LLPELGLAGDKLLGGPNDGVGDPLDRLHVRVGCSADDFEKAEELVAGALVHGFEHLRFHPVDQELDEHQHHREAEGQRGGVELDVEAAEQAFHDRLQVAHVLLGELGDDMGDADDGAEEAHHGRGPNNDPHEGVTVLLANDIHLGQVFQLRFKPGCRAVALDAGQGIGQSPAEIRIALARR
jgi:hypothetical protein